MKLRIMSDLHLHRKDDVPYVPLDEDVLILAGDIAEGTQGTDWVKRQNIKVPVLYVPGNHEFYGQDIPKLHAEFRKVKHCKVMVNETVTIGDVVFVGTTLWTDFNVFGNAPLHGEMTRRALNDFLYINRKGKRFTPADQIAYNRQAIRFLKKVVENKDPTKTYVLLTHFCAEWSIAARFRNDPVTAGFATKLPYGLEQNFKLWVHGHTHDQFDYKIGDCRIVCNPRGYVLEQNAFRSDLIVEV